jgi:hypothetical protein
MGHHKLKTRSVGHIGEIVLQDTKLCRSQLKVGHGIKPFGHKFCPILTPW